MAHSLLCVPSIRLGSRVAAMTGGCLLTIAVVTGSGCLLFTDPINMPPTIEIVPPAPIWRGQKVAFQANVSDPNGDVVTVDWARVVGPCSDIPAPAERTRGQTLPVDETETDMPFCVWAFATDSHGATIHRSFQANPLDHPPVPAISIVYPNPVPKFPLYSTLKFSGAGSTDADLSDVSKLTYQWTLVMRPIGSLVSLGPSGSPRSLECPTDMVSEFTCLTPDMPGNYQVQLAVDDHFDPLSPTTKSSTTIPVTVADDAFPCLGATTPTLLASSIVRNPDDPTDALFAVMTVIDDGDPFPAGPFGGAHFSWFLGHGKTDPVVYLGPRDFPSYTVPQGTFVVGDNARVRVEIHDRDRNQTAIDAALLGCRDEPMCAVVPGSGCFQRMTWEIAYQ